MFMRLQGNFGGLICVSPVRTLRLTLSQGIDFINIAETILVAKLNDVGELAEYQSWNEEGKTAVQLLINLDKSKPQLCAGFYVDIKDMPEIVFILIIVPTANIMSCFIN